MNENTPSAGLRFDKAEAYCPVEPSHDAIGRRDASSRRGRPQNATARLSRFDEADCSQEDRQVAEGNNVARHTYATLALFAKQIGACPGPHLSTFQVRELYPAQSNRCAKTPTRSGNCLVIRGQIAYV